MSIGSAINDLICRVEKSLFKDGNATEAAINELRLAQLRRTIAVTQFLIWVNLFNATVVTLAATSKGAGAPILLWGAFMGLFSAFVLMTLPKREWDYTKKTISTRTIRKMTLNSGLLGIFWGVMPLFALYHTPGMPDVHVIAVVAGMTGGGAVALAFVPTAMFAYIGAISTLSGVAIMQVISIESASLLSLLLAYTATILITGHSFARSFARAVAREVQNREQAATIDILLKEYESGGRDWIWESDEHGTMIRGAEEFAKATGMPDGAAFQKHVKEQLASGIRWEGALTLCKMIYRREQIADMTVEVRGHGEYLAWFAVSGKPIMDHDGKFRGYRGVASDITANIMHRRRIENLASYDQMTQTLNRSAFVATVTQALSEKDESRPDFCLFYIDLDGFKAINDGRGHAAGDLVLIEVAKRLKALAGENIVVARVGGDEFAMMVKTKRGSGEAEKLAQAVVQRMSDPFRISDHHVFIGCSLGGAWAGIDGDNPRALMNAADIALYHAKADGKGRACFFRADMEAQAKHELAIRDALTQALKENKLTVAYQPFYESDGKTLAGFEALARWSDPVLGDISPAVFIPIAERCGLIEKLGDYILFNACQTAMMWPENLSVSVNISVPQFREGRVVETIAETLKNTGLAANRLEVEITEQVFAERADEMVGHIRAIKKLGVTVSLDDFGTGYSSLSYLLKFPIDKLKIDQSFVALAQTDETALGILETIVALGHRLDLKTTVEGIENAEQMSMLTPMKCNYLQGFLFSRPLPPAEVAAEISKAFVETIPTGSAETKASDRIAS